jgi:predicted membrane channel-forming protein YqfA (hemolysin III family)
MSDQEINEKQKLKKNQKILNPRITTFEDAPKHLQRNPFILTGYRVDFDIAMALKSLFQNHNELVNSWSHIYGTILFLLFSIYTFNIFLENSSKIDFGDILCWSVYLLSVLNTFLSSSIYHLVGLCHHNTKVFRVCYWFDDSFLTHWKYGCQCCWWNCLWIFFSRILLLDV